MRTRVLTAVALLLLGAAAPSSHAPGPTHLIAGGKGTATLLLGPQLQGAREASMNRLVLAPGAEVPEHVHESSAEMLYIESGQVEMTIAGKRSSAGAGDAIYIPAGARHSARVTSPADSVRAVQVYVGPGPEKRFLEGPQVDGP